MNRKLSSSLELIPFCPRRIWESRTRYKLSMQTMYFLCFLLPDLELYMSFRLYWIPSFSSSPTNKDNQYQESKSLNQLQTHIATDIQSAKPVCPTDHKIIASWNKHPPCHLMYPPYHSVSPTEAELTLGSRSHLLSHLPPGVLRSLNLLPLRAGANITLCWSNHGKPTTRGTTAIVILQAMNRRIWHNHLCKQQEMNLPSFTNYQIQSFLHLPPSSGNRPTFSLLIINLHFLLLPLSFCEHSYLTIY